MTHPKSHTAPSCRPAAWLVLWSCAVATSATASPQEPLVLPSGVEVRVTRPVTGEQRFPGPGDTVKVHYEGALSNGHVFDSSYWRGQPARFPLTRVIPCWTQGIQQVPVGATAVLKCPAATAYGTKGAGNGVIPPNADLTFTVHLLETGKP